MTEDRTDLKEFWVVECANCHSPITIKREDGRPIFVRGNSFRMPCGECGLDGEYPHSDIRIMSESDD